MGLLVGLFNGIIVAIILHKFYDYLDRLPP